MTAHSLMGLSFMALLAVSSAIAGEVEVPIDNSRAVQLARPASTILVGNPSIADVTVVDGTHLYILGRSFGSTNVIALDSKGEAIARLDVVVNKDLPRTVTLHKGIAQTTYACSGGSCEQALMLGDSADSFKTLADAISTKAGSASSTASGSGTSR